MSGIAVRNLIYEVPQKRILNGIDLEIAQGEIISIMGQSGSGKTTLLKLMTGLLKPTSGQIVIDDVDITGLRETELDQVRLKMGLVSAGHAAREETRFGNRRGTGGVRQNSGLDQKIPVQEGCGGPQKETLRNMGRVPGHCAKFVESSRGGRTSCSSIKLPPRQKRMHQFHQFQKCKNLVKRSNIWDI